MVATGPGTAARPAAEYAIEGQEPRSVERPASAEAAAASLRQAAESGSAVVPWGAGTKQRLGNAPRAYDVALDMTALDAVVEYEPADLVVTAQAGITLASLQARLAQAGQFLALDPPYAERATLGGTLASNVSGPSRLLYGTARDLVLGLRVATPQGEVVKSGGRVVKNVVGYDLNKMHVGALGTLGVIAEVTLKVHPLPAAEATVAASFPRLEQAHAAAGTLFRSQLYLRAVQLACLPAGAVPAVDGGGGWSVLGWAAGSPATVERQVRDATAWCREAGGARVQRLDGAEHRQLWQTLRALGRPAGGVLLKVAALPSALAAVAAAVQEAFPAAALVAQAGNGVLYADLPADVAALRPLVDRLSGQGASVVIEEAPGEIKSQIDVWGPTRSDFPLMQALKRELDPAATLNPGRFVGGI